MRKAMLVVGLVAGLAVPLVVRAQSQFVLDSAQQAASMEVARKSSKPAAFVLQHRAELELTPVQVAALEALAQAQRDSATVRQARLVSQMQANPPSAVMVAVGGWTGEIDESALRDVLCQQSANSMDVVLGLARDRRATAALLTAAQVAQLPGLQIGDYMTAIKRP
ncbi:MAG: Spy/CpxP family protein refolding chaperone [Gemmatimonadaceae bacterium]|nr:Spy/CpxP family protein refolding chaperone [Gemmatimonadaceae bacterium]